MAPAGKLRGDLVSGSTTPSRSQRLLFLAAAIAPAALPLFAIWRYAVNVPYMDEWDFIKDLHLANEQGRLLSHLFTQFNESRPALSRLLFLALAKLSHADFRAPMLVSWLVACLTAWNVWRLAKPANDTLHLAAVAVANLLIFSPIQFETWLWGNQIITLIPMLFLTSALRILQSARLNPHASLALALAFGVGAMYSFSGGILVLPAIGAALVFLWPHSDIYRRMAIICWTLTFTVAAGFYFHGYVTPPNHTELAKALESPLQTIRYFIMFLGSVHGNGEPFVTLPAGLMLLAAFVATLRHPKGRPIQIVTFVVLLSATLTALGRSTLGVEQALSFRYMSVSLYLTVGVIALAMRNSQRTLLALLVGAVGATSVHGCVRGLLLSATDYRAKQYARTCASLSHQTIEGCKEFSLYPGWDFVRANAPVMERLGLFKPGMFRGPSGDGAEVPTGTLAVEDRVWKGKVEVPAGQAVHAILLYFRAHGQPPKLYGSALPSLPPHLQWESRLEPPKEASEILAYGYDADSGRTVLLAKAKLTAN